jgi:hypothetical protein
MFFHHKPSTYWGSPHGYGNHLNGWFMINDGHGNP